MLFAVIESMTIGESLLISLVGFSIVFAALVVLMFMIKLITATAGFFEGKAAAQAVVPSKPAAPAAPSAVPSGMVPAKGSQGDIMLNDVDEKTAALVMAVVADELKAPLNELRFKSIRTK